MERSFHPGECEATCPPSSKRAKKQCLQIRGGGQWQNDIPEHLLLLIFEAMQFRDDGVELLKVAERVCRRWRRAAQGTLLLDTAGSKRRRKHRLDALSASGNKSDEGNGTRDTRLGVNGEVDDGEGEIQSRAAKIVGDRSACGRESYDYDYFQESMDVVVPKKYLQ